jgi:hypothetical protein
MPRCRKQVDPEIFMAVHNIQRRRPASRNPSACLDLHRHLAAQEVDPNGMCDLSKTRSVR